MAQSGWGRSSCSLTRSHSCRMKCQASGGSIGRGGSAFCCPNLRASEKLVRACIRFRQSIRPTSIQASAPTDGETPFESHTIAWPYE